MQEVGVGCDSNGDLNRDSNHKSRDLDLQFEPTKTDLGGIPAVWALQFHLRFAFCDLRFGARRSECPSKLTSTTHQAS